MNDQNKNNWLTDLLEDLARKGLSHSNYGDSAESLMIVKNNSNQLKN